MARQFASKGSDRPQLVHSARVSLLARVDKYNDPKNLEWKWDDVTDKWERHALSAVQDLVAAESERDEMREQLTRLREATGAALEWIEASLDYDDLAMDGSKVMAALREALSPQEGSREQNR